MKLARCNAPDGQQFRAGQATLFCLLPPHDEKTPHQFATCCPTCGQTVTTAPKTGVRPEVAPEATAG